MSIGICFDSDNDTYNEDDHAIGRMIAVGLINGNTGQPFDTEEDFFQAVRNLVANAKKGEGE